MTRSLPIVAILSFVLGLLAITALQSIARGDTPAAPAPLVVDAGVALAAPAGAPAVTLPAVPPKPHDTIDDPTRDPGAYLSDVELARKSGGIWLAILVGLYGIGLAVVRIVPSLAPKPDAERTRAVALAAGAMTTLGAGVDAMAGGGTMLAVLVALLGAAMLAIDPHTPPPGGIGTSPK